MTIKQITRYHFIKLLYSVSLKLGIRLWLSVENGEVFGCVFRCLLRNTCSTTTNNELSVSVSQAQNLILESDSHRLLIMAEVEEKLDNFICTRVVYT